VIIREDIGLDDRRQVSFHVVEDKINVQIVMRLEDVEQCYDVRVVRQFRQYDNLKAEG